MPPLAPAVAAALRLARRVAVLFCSAFGLVVAALMAGCTAGDTTVEAGGVGEPPAPLSERAPGCDGWGLVYEVYVRSYQDSDGDGIGDLEGLQSRLGHVEALGVDTLWLMPVFPAFGPAGYDVEDFGSVTPEYGDLAALDALVADAHARGMRVLLDLPFNHVHANHPWFVAAEAGDDAARARFVYADTPGDDGRWWPSAAGGWYYGYFGPAMPDLDYDNPAVLAEMSAVWDTWLDHVDGFRLDAVLMLDEEDGVTEGAPAAHAALGALVDAARAAHPEVCLLAEASEWEAGRTATWLDSGLWSGADRVLDFVRQDALVDAGATGDSGGLRDVLAIEGEADGFDGMGTFLGSHDLARLPARIPDAARREAARVVQLLLPGAPVLYYGEELDLADATSGTGQDYAMRAPMPWDDSEHAGFTTGWPWFVPDPGYRDGANVAAQQAEPDSPLAVVQAVGALRREWHLEEGDTWRPVAGLPAGVVGFRRVSSVGEVTVYANLGADTIATDTSAAHPILASDAGVGPLGAGAWRVWATAG